MDYCIEDKPAFTTVGKGIRVSTAGNSHQEAIPAFWRSVSGSERLYTLQKHDGLIGRAVLGVCADFDPVQGAFTYEIAVETVPDVDFGEYTRRDIPAATWAVFESVGGLPGAIQAVWARIFSEFFPTSGYEQAPGLPQFERYPPGDVSSDTYVCEVWIPVVKK